MRKWWNELIAALRRGKRFVTHDVWRIGMPGEEIPHGLIIKNVRVVILLFRGLTEETLLLRASALAFSTILFLVPFLAFVFAFIQTFNLGDQVYNQLSASLNNRLEQIAAIVRAQTSPADDAANDDTGAEDTAKAPATATAPATPPPPAPEVVAGTP